MSLIRNEEASPAPECRCSSLLDLDTRADDTMLLKRRMTSVVTSLIRLDPLELWPAVSVEPREERLYAATGATGELRAVGVALWGT